MNRAEKRMLRTNALSACFLLLTVVILLASFSYGWYGSVLETPLRNVNGHVIYLARYFESGNGTSPNKLTSGYTGEGDNEEWTAGVTSGGAIATEAQFQNPSTDGAFEIKTPEQLYNLAWLQFMGYFTDPEKDTSNIPTYYFYLSKDLDMSGYTLPPIGNDDHPFIGNFDGNGHSISNLKISNDSSRYNGVSEPPKVIREEIENSKVPDDEFQIVGLFGVVGNISGSAIDANGYTYSSQINEVKNLTVNNITVSTQTENTLAGIAAGYVNATMSAVSVNGGTIVNAKGAALVNGPTESISDYAIVGYATENYLDTVDQDSVVNYHYVAATQPMFVNQNLAIAALKKGESDSWGGSIDMKSMYDTLQDKWTAAKRENNYSFRYSDGQTIRIDVNGAKTVTDNTERTITYYYSGWNGTYLKALDWDGSGQYVFVNRTNATAYTYLFGRRAYDYTTTTINEYYGQTISNNGYYLNTDTSSAFGSASAQTYWVIDSENHKIYTYVDETNGAKYYLNYQNGSLNVSTTPVSNWTFADGKIYHNSEASGEQLYCADGTWMVDDLETTTLSGYTISFNYNNVTRYLVSNGVGNALTTTTDRNQASFWERSNNSYVLKGSNAYIAYNNNDAAILSTTANNWTISGNYLQYTTGNWWNSTTNYLRYNGSFNTTTSNRNRTSFNYSNYTKTTTYDKTVSLGNSTIRTYSDTLAEQRFPDMLSTVFPLKFDSQNKTDKGNTGYVIAAGNVSAGDIRVSQYSMSDISVALNQTSYNNSRLEVITRTSSGWRRVSDNYNQSNGSVSSSLRNITKTSYTDLGLTEYENARDNLEGVFTEDSSNIYGLHFMDAQINKDNVITVPGGYINGEEFTNLEMPTDSIDFHLKTPGKITFFAGSYFPDNTAFFSLHHILRDENKVITDIKEIKKIYANGEKDDDYPYVYEYGDGTFSTGTVSGSAIFNTDWITAPDNIIENAVYYFEVPANGGEYALGSVPGKDGAYLMYLDISANGKITSDEGYIDTIHTVDVVETRTYSYDTPRGVNFTDAQTQFTSYAEVNSKLDGTGTISFGRSGDAVSGSGEFTETVTFIHDGMTYTKADGTVLTEAEVRPTEYVTVSSIYTKTMTVKLYDELSNIDDELYITYSYDHNINSDVVRVLYADPLVYMIVYNEDMLLDMNGSSEKLEITTKNGFRGEIYTCAVSGSQAAPPAVSDDLYFQPLGSGKAFLLSAKSSYFEVYPDDSAALFKVKSEEDHVDATLASSSSNGNMTFTYDVTGTALNDAETYVDGVTIPTDTDTHKTPKLTMVIPTKANNYNLDSEGNVIGSGIVTPAISIMSVGPRNLLSVQGAGKLSLGAAGIDGGKLTISPDPDEQQTSDQGDAAQIETLPEDDDYSKLIDSWTYVRPEIPASFPIRVEQTIIREGSGQTETDPEEGGEGEDPETATGSAITTGAAITTGGAISIDPENASGAAITTGAAVSTDAAITTDTAITTDAAISTEPAISTDAAISTEPAISTDAAVSADSAISSGEDEGSENDPSIPGEAPVSDEDAIVPDPGLGEGRDEDDGPADAGDTPVILGDGKNEGEPSDEEVPSEADVH